MSTYDSVTAFPVDSDSEYGLSKREYFIAKALQGLCANVNFEIVNVGEVASLAIEVTDKLLEKLGDE